MSRTKTVRERARTFGLYIFFQKKIEIDLTGWFRLTFEGFVNRKENIVIAAIYIV